MAAVASTDAPSTVMRASSLPVSFRVEPSRTLNSDSVSFSPRVSVTALPSVFSSTTVLAGMEIGDVMVMSSVSVITTLEPAAALIFATSASCAGFSSGFSITGAGGKAVHATQSQSLPPSGSVRLALK